MYKPITTEEQPLPGSSHFSRAMYEEDPGDEVGNTFVLQLEDEVKEMVLEPVYLTEKL